MNRATGRLPTSLVTAMAKALDRLGFTPNTLTVLGFCGSAAAALLLAAGHPLTASAVFLAASSLDMMDGTLARLQRKATVFGALLDSTLDRYSEAAMLAGLAYYRAVRTELDVATLLLILAALVGSIMVSYVRARAEGLGLSGKTGIFQRPLRVVAVTAAVAIPPAMVPLLVLLAVGSHATVVHRVFSVWRQSKDRAAV